MPASVDAAPAPPEVAGTIFGAGLPAAVAYAGLLAGAGVTRGLIGPGEASRIWERHLLNCAVVAELIPGYREGGYREGGCDDGGPAVAGHDPGTIADVGSGAGLPGLVLAIMLPKARVVLIEPMARRAAFLGECTDQLGLANVQVVRGRAEDLAGDIDADVVTARAVARLDRLAELAAGIARLGGLVLAIKGASAGEELRQAGPVLDRLGLTGAEVVRAGAAVLAEPTTVIRFRTAAGGLRALRQRGGRRGSQ